MKSNDQLRREIFLSLRYSESQIEEIIQELNNYVPSPAPVPVKKKIPTNQEHTTVDSNLECTLTMEEIRPIIEDNKVEKKKTAARKEYAKAVAKSTSRTYRDSRPDSLHNIKHLLVQTRMEIPS